MISQSLTDLWYGFGVAFQLHNLMWSFFGVLVGNLIGVLPGMGALSAKMCIRDRGHFLLQRLDLVGQLQLGALALLVLLLHLLAQIQDGLAGLVI